MASSSKLIEISFFVILLLCSTFSLVRCHSDASNVLVQPNCLNVPIDHFVASVNSTIHKVGKVTSFISKFTNISGLYGCLEMLDHSTEELGWTLEALLHPHDTKVGTGDLGSDLRTWLSSVLVNHDSCEELLDHGSNNIITLVGKRLNKIASSVTRTLNMVHPNFDAQDVSRGYSWLEIRRRKLIRTGKKPAHVTVALDGSGDFTSINEAVKSAPDRSSRRYVIHVKRGVYREYVKIEKHKWNIMMVGDGMDATIITGNRSVQDDLTTYDTATFCVKGRGFIGRDITFENTAGPEKHQAVAFLSDADLTALYRCGIKGYQDSLYAHKNRQFYKDCVITGTVDFIFGRASAVFQDCQIIARKGLPKQKNTITAQGRQHESEVSGFSIQHCKISVLPEVAKDSSVQTYLGRPWKKYSTTVIMRSDISTGISPQGWLPWAGNYGLDTLYYGEYMNSGGGSDVRKRVEWPGFHVIKDKAVVDRFSVEKLIAGNSWLPSVGIEYSPGL